MAKKIDYEKLGERITKIVRDHLNDSEIPIPVADVLDVCFALDRLRMIQEDIEGKFQEI